jgi:heat shock protein HtpX
MDRDQYRKRRLHRGLLTMAYLAAILGLLLGSAWLVFGLVGAFWVATGSLLVLGMSGQLPARALMRLRGAHPLHPSQAPELSAVVAELSRRARLDRPPALYLAASAQPQACAVGAAGDAAVGVSSGLLRLLDGRELAGVLAHEISHVAAGDTHLLALAQVARRLTGSIVLMGWLVFGLSVLGALPEVSLLVPVVLTVVPTVSLLVESAVSRTREYDADLRAASLLGDPRALASALLKLERFQHRLGWLLPVLVADGVPPALLRSHPDSRERVRRLLELVPRSAIEPVQHPISRPWTPAWHAGGSGRWSGARDRPVWVVARW